MKLIEYLSRLSRTKLLMSGLALVLIVAFFDFVTGPEISVSIFYLIPISIVALILGSRWGVLISLASAVTWLLADLLAGPAYSHPAIPYWNAAVRFGFFLIVTFSLSAMTAAQRQREEFLHFIVHDLRAPLSNVISGLQSIQHFGAKTLDANLNDFVRICMISSNRMMTLILSILDLARLQNRKMPLQLVQLAVQKIVESSLDMVSVWAKSNRVKLAFQRDPNVESVYADPAITERILVNLLSNAIKFSKPESTVTVFARPFETQKVALSVSDQGEGISKDWADKVFDKFAQAEMSHSTGSAGTGLGLAFCRLAVEAQGGSIWLESETHAGTTMTFTLPRIGGSSPSAH